MASQITGTYGFAIGEILQTTYTRKKYFISAETMHGEQLIAAYNTEVDPIY